jgi:hypothetical protein
MSKAVAGVLLAALATPLAAQWLRYSAPGIPRTADGKPNLSAPAPKLPDGTPDLSGIWEQKNSRTTAYYLDGIDIPWQPSSAALLKQRIENNQVDNPESRCLPRGVPKTDAFDLHKIVQFPGLIVILYEYQTTFRQIFTDGRELPKDPNPTWMGYSVGHWERDTLVFVEVKSRQTDDYGAPERAIGLDPVPEMVTAPRDNPYIFFQAAKGGA